MGCLFILKLKCPRVAPLGMLSEQVRVTQPGVRESGERSRRSPLRDGLTSLLQKSETNTNNVLLCNC